MNSFILNEFSKNNPTTSLDHEINCLNSEWSDIFKKITSREQLQVAKDHLKLLKVTIDALTKENLQIVNETETNAEKLIPHNQKIVPQRRLLSTKQKINSARSICKAKSVSFSYIRRVISLKITHITQSL